MVKTKEIKLDKTKFLIVVFAITFLFTLFVAIFFTPKEYHINCSDGTHEKLECYKDYYCKNEDNFYLGEKLPDKWKDKQQEVCENDIQ